MARKSRVTKIEEASEIPMTPMIDVVFQLLVYFIFTMKPMDVVAHLDVFRPSPEKQSEQTEVPPKLIRIAIYPDGYMINDRRVRVAELDSLIQRLASFDKNQTIMIMCTALSEHRRLVHVLDLCAKSGLTNLSVVSTN